MHFHKQTLLIPFLSSALCADPMHRLPDFEVVGRETSLIGASIAGSEGVYGQADLEYRPILRTGEVLEVVPGLIVTQHSGTGKANQYFLRGFNLDHGTDFACEGLPCGQGELGDRGRRACKDVDVHRAT